MRENVESDFSGNTPDKPDTNRENPKPVDWEKYLEKLPPRSSIDPGGKLRTSEVIEILCARLLRGEVAPSQPSIHKLSEGLPIGFGWLLTEDSEYWDVIDEGIRGLVRAVNRLDFVKTKSSCSGHFPIQIDFDKPRDFFRLGPEGVEYNQPLLVLLLDRDSGETEKFIQIIQKTAQQLTAKYPNFCLDIEEKFFRGEENKRIRILTLRPRIAVSSAYIREKQLQAPNDLVRSVSAKKNAPGDQNKEGPALWHHVNLTEHAILQASLKEYYPYFNSGEPEQILREFFDTLQAEIDTAFPKKK